MHASANDRLRDMYMYWHVSKADVPSPAPITVKSVTTASVLANLDPADPEVAAAFREAGENPEHHMAAYQQLCDCLRELPELTTDAWDNIFSSM